MLLLLLPLLPSSPSLFTAATDSSTQNFCQNFLSMASQDPQTFHWYFTEDHRGIRFHNRVLLLSVTLFIFIVVVNLLLLYARWLCRRRSTAHAHLAGGSQSTYAARTLQPADCCGLEATAIDSFPIVLYGSPGDSDEFKGVVKETECSICLGAFQEEEKIKILPRCHHAYHAECVDKWLRSHSSCPLCRAPLRLEHLDELAIP